MNTETRSLALVIDGDATGRKMLMRRLRRTKAPTLQDVERETRRFVRGQMDNDGGPMGSLFGGTTFGEDMLLALGRTTLKRVNWNSLARHYMRKLRKTVRP